MPKYKISYDGGIKISSIQDNLDQAEEARIRAHCTNIASTIWKRENGGTVASQYPTIEHNLMMWSGLMMRFDQNILQSAVENMQPVNSVSFSTCQYTVEKDIKTAISKAYSEASNRPGPKP